MARSGDGNFFHIESPDQLPEIFETELSGLSATLGQRVSLGVEPQSGVKVMNVLNDLDQTNTKRYKLPNLVVGSPINVVVRLQIPALSQSAELLKVRLAWDDSEQKSILEDLEMDYQSGRVTSARKKAFSQSYNLSRSGRSKPRRSMDEK